MNAQNTSVDSNSTRGIYTVAPRVGLGIHDFLNTEIGIHDFLNTEIGISELYIDNQNFNFGATSIYSTFILQQESWSFDKYALGWKIGFQNSWSIFMWGLELKRLYSNNRNYDYLSPKIGLSWMDVFNLEYAFNLIDKKKNFEINSTHQISINMSLNKKIKAEVYRKF